MKFTKSKKEPQEPKKTPQEEYASQITSLTETELRDLHKDLKIDHYGNSTAAVINTASGVGLLSMRSTTRRYRTECWQIEAMEARMKEQGWTPHPNRYRDAVPIALGVAAGTTSGITFGLVNVEKNAKRTKDYVKKRDMFKTKEVVEAIEVDAGDEEDDFVEEAETMEAAIETPQTLGKITEPIVVEHEIATKPVSAAAVTGFETIVPQPEGLGIAIENTTITEEVFTGPTVSIATEASAPSVDAIAATEPKKTKKEALFSQVTVMNKTVRSFTFKKDKKEKETTISVTEIPCDAESPVVDTGAGVGHGTVEKLDGPPTYNFVPKECVA